jgi:hypothetical protein
MHLADSQQAAPGAAHPIDLQVFGQSARLVIDDQIVARTITACYSAFEQSFQNLNDLPIEIAVRGGPTKFDWFVIHGDSSELCGSLPDLVYVIEKTLTIELQRRRPDLFFLHAAVLSKGGRCVVIVGESGAGKSTLCWELCYGGFSYMSDELAPINLDTLRVEAYPRAIGLKRVTRQMSALPDRTIRLGSTLHIPVEAVPGGFQRKPSAIETIVFLQKVNGHAAPRIQEIPRSEAAARLYANGLNQLAHKRDGLTAVVRLAGVRQCFSLSRGSPTEMRQALMHCIGSN